MTRTHTMRHAMAAAVFYAATVAALTWGAWVSTDDQPAVAECATDYDCEQLSGENYGYNWTGHDGERDYVPTIEVRNAAYSGVDAMGDCRAILAGLDYSALSIDQRCSNWTFLANDGGVVGLFTWDGTGWVAYPVIGDCSDINWSQSDGDGRIFLPVDDNGDGSISCTSDFELGA